jgi:hypothetical protein
VGDNRRPRGFCLVAKRSLQRCWSPICSQRNSAERAALQTGIGCRPVPIFVAPIDPDGPSASGGAGRTARELIAWERPRARRLVRRRASCRRGQLRARRSAQSTGTGWGSGAGAGVGVGVGVEGSDMAGVPFIWRLGRRPVPPPCGSRRCGTARRPSNRRTPGFQGHAPCRRARPPAAPGRACRSCAR